MASERFSSRPQARLPREVNWTCTPAEDKLSNICSTVAEGRERTFCIEVSDRKGPCIVTRVGNGDLWR